jgi:Lrp/AsnC family leucine-responsive transcriptional regulator
MDHLFWTAEIPLMPKSDLDAIDRRIVAELQADARLTNVELADRVGLSPSPCLRRVKRLQREGYIEGYLAALRRDRVGLGLSVFIGVKIDGHANERALKFEEAVGALPEVIACHLVSGEADYFLEVVVLNRESMAKVMQAKTPVERLDAHIAAMDERLASLKEVKPALAALYAALGEEQRKKAQSDPHRHGLHDVGDAGVGLAHHTCARFPWCAQLLPRCAQLPVTGSPNVLACWSVPALGLPQLSALRRVQLVEDRAVRTVVAFACVDQTGQDSDDRAMRIHAVDNRLLVLLGQGTDLSARTLLVAPEVEQLVDLLDREAEGAGAPDEAQLVHVARIEDPVTIRIAASRAQEPRPLEVSDQLGGNA